MIDLPSTRGPDPRTPGRGGRASHALVAMTLVAIAVAAIPERSLAQESPQDGQRSPVVAALLQAALPPLPLGYVYVGELRRAILPTALMVGGSMVFIVGTVELIDWTDEDRSPALFYGGLAAMLVGYAYGILDAADAARDRNARLRGITPSVSVGPVGAGFGLRVWLRHR